MTDQPSVPAGYLGVFLGGSVLAPAEDTPFGRMATLAVPMGATFAVISVGE